MTNTERNQIILRRHQSGETLIRIGADYGLTRERVRQIVAKMGGEPKHSLSQKRRAAIVAIIRENDFTRQEANEHFGFNTYGIAFKEGHKFREPDYLYTSPEIAMMADKVRGGMSIRKAAGCDRQTETLLGHYCKKHGIKSKSGTRWADLSHRNSIITNMRTSGATWADIAAEIAIVEGRHTCEQALVNWCKNNMEGVPPLVRERHMRVRSARRKSTPTAAAHWRKKPTVIVAQSAKEAARLNYGKASASAIAFVHGVSRNSIIGHWFRLRRQGVIA